MTAEAATVTTLSLQSVGYAAAGSAATAAELWPGRPAADQVINGVLYWGHALERMAPEAFGGRGVPVSVVENALRYGKAIPSEVPGRVLHIFGNVTVVTNLAGDEVVTVIKTGR